MEQFSEEHSKLLLAKEWLVKIDSQKSTPYLLKFFSSTLDISCFILITDMKSVWSEVLSSQQFARRWRDCNKLGMPHVGESEEETSWRISNLSLLSEAHTLGGITDLSFDVIQSNFSNFAFELECEAFKWRWETCFLGYRSSADIISQHLVMPLISVNHLAFASADPVCELEEAELEKEVDKVGRTARRTVDTHIKHAISKPRVATTLRRMTAIFNFVPELPAICSTVERPELRDPALQPKTRISSHFLTKSRSISPNPIASKSDWKVADPAPEASSMHHEMPVKQSANPDSATESESEERVTCFASIDNARSVMRTSPRPYVAQEANSPQPNSSKVSSQKMALDSNSESSPPRPAKKAKPRTSSSDDDSEAERKRRVAQLKRGSGTISKQGTRQPIKRGGKRF